MAIIRKKKVTAAERESTSTHFPNETKKKPEDSDSSVVNNQTPNDLLVDPEDVPGSTHFTNDEKFSEKTNRIHASKTKKAPLKAGKTFGDEDFPEEEEDQDAEFGEDEDPDSGVEAGTEEEACEDTNGDTQHTPNGEGSNPADGYLTVGDADEDDLDEDMEEDEGDEVDASEIDPASLGKGDTKQQTMVVEDDDWDPEQASVDEFEDEEDEGDEPEEEIEDEVEASVKRKPTTAASDQMDLVDVDGTDDLGDDVVFATVGTRLHAIKGNRIVASLGKKYAVKAGHADMYLSDQFQDVLGVEMSKHGLRAGLAKMGFVLAKVDITKNEVINKRVEAKSKQVTAAIRRSTVASNSAMAQCLAIASVGINRSYFKDTKNELRAALQEELEAAGVRGANAMLRRVFASKGVEYAKSIITLASKLSELPEKARNQFVAALDMTADGTEDETDDLDDEDDLNGDSASPDFQAEYADADGEDADEDFDDDFEEEIEAPETVAAALSRPIHRRSKVSAKAAGYSVSAAAVLSGDAPFPWQFK